MRTGYMHYAAMHGMPPHTLFSKIGHICQYLKNKPICYNLFFINNHFVTIFNNFMTITCDFNNALFFFKDKSVTICVLYVINKMFCFT